MNDLLEKPQKPADSECCESACSPCVWDIYQEKLQLWKEQQANQKVASEQSDSDG